MTVPLEWQPDLKTGEEVQQLIEALDELLLAGEITPADFEAAQHKVAVVANELPDKDFLQ